MNFSHQAGIALVEASYHLSEDEPAWLARVVEAASSLIDGGFGTTAVTGKISSSEATFLPDGFSGPSELMSIQAAVLSELPKPVLVDARTGVRFVSDHNKENAPVLDLWRRHLGSANDALKLTAVDSDLRMVYLFAPTREARIISSAEHVVWKMLAAHVSSGLRLHRALRAQRSMQGSSPSALPHGADAVIDPCAFALTDAIGPARTKSASVALREAAVLVDRARTERTKAASDDAFAGWEALVAARWSMVDWFDTDGRRYILAIPNEPDIGDPRMLTEREGQVAAYAALGENHKLISFRLGVSRARVTVHLRSIMRKLGVRTQAQLVANLSPFARAFGKNRRRDKDTDDVE
jgi:DNA-binding CsgD family transcriptional regulator